MNERITIDPMICHGKPVILGTRVPISRIVNGLAGGMTRDEIVQEYEVALADIDAALFYAADLIDHEQVYALAS